MGREVLGVGGIEAASIASGLLSSNPLQLPPSLSNHTSASTQLC